MTSPTPPANTQPHHQPHYLGSQSPRRASLLQQANYTFTQISPPFDDSHIKSNLDAQSLAQHLATKKAQSLTTILNAGIAITADTLLSFNDHTICKPHTRNEAETMLRSLFDHTHTVITAAVVINLATHKSQLITDTVQVTIPTQNEQTFQQYLNDNHWQGKAGGYNLAELQSQWNIKIQGEPTTVIGLPMPKLITTLK